MTFSARLLRRRHLLALCTAALAPPVLARTAWPTRPVRIIVPAGPGSSLDLVARSMSAGLGALWNTPVVIENRVGAGGLIGMDLAVKSRDGHTLALGFNGPVALAPFLYRRMPYDPARDLAPILLTTQQPNVLAVNAEKLPARTMAEFVAWARARKGRLNFASLGNGSSAHLTMELLMSEAGFEGTHVPFNGSPPAALALAQGEVEAAFMLAPALLPHVQSGRVRLLAVSGAQRSTTLGPLLGALPTLAEAGWPNIVSLAWNGLFAPVATAVGVLEQVNTDANQVLRDPAVWRTLDLQGLAVAGGSAEDFRLVIEADVRRWGPVISRLGIRLD